MPLGRAAGFHVFEQCIKRWLSSMLQYALHTLLQCVFVHALVDAWAALSQCAPSVPVVHQVTVVAVGQTCPREAAYVPRCAMHAPVSCALGELQ
jgi:hypothetical protein